MTWRPGPNRPRSTRPGGATRTSIWACRKQDCAPGWAPLPLDLRGGLSGRLGGSAGGTLQLSGLSGRLDGVALKGDLGFARSVRTRLNADLTLDRLPLDKLLTLNGAPGFDYDLTVKAGSATLDGLNARSVGFHLRHDAARTSLTDATATLAGVTLAARYSAANDGTIEADLSGAAPDSQLLARALPAPLIASPGFLKAPLKFKGQFKGTASRLAGNLSASVGDSQITIAPVIDWPDQTASGVLTLRNPGAWLLAEQLGVMGLEHWAGVGSASLIARFHAAPGHLSADYLDLVLGGMRVKGALDYARDDQHGWSLRGRLAADRLPLGWPPMTMQTPFPSGWLADGHAALALSARSLVLNDQPVGRDFHTDLGLAQGVLSLANFAVKLGDGGISGHGAWHGLDAQPWAETDLDLHGLALPPALTGGKSDLSGGVLGGHVALSAKGHDAATMLATLGGNLDLALDNSTLTGSDLAKARAALKLAGVDRVRAALTAALRKGSAPLGHLHLAGSVQDGEWTLAGSSLDGGDLAGGIDLANHALDLRLTLRAPDGAKDGAPPVLAHYKGPWGAPGVTLEMEAYKAYLQQKSRRPALSPARKAPATAARARKPG